MADISLKIKSDFAQAEKDFKSLNMTTQNVSKSMEKFRSEFKTGQIDKFIERNKLNASAIRATQGPLASVTAETKGLQREIETLIKRGLSPESAEIKKLQGEYIRSRSELEKLNASKKKTNSSFREGIVAIAKYAAAYVSFRAVTGVVKNLTQGLAEQGDVLAKTSRQMGLTVEGLQELRFAADRSGVSAGNFDKSMQKLNKAVGEARAGTGTLTTLLNKTNPVLLQQVQAAGSTEEAFSLLADELNRMPSAADRAALATAAFGRSGMGIITMAEGGSEAIAALREEARKYGDIISTETALKSEKFIDAQTNMKAALKGVAVEMGAPLLTPLTNAMQGFADWAATGDNLKNALLTIGYVLAGATSGIIAFTVATKGALVINTLTMAIKAMTVAMAANPLTAIAVLISAVLVPGIIWLAKNWDLAKFKIMDFAQTGKIMLMEFGKTIFDGVMKPINAMLNQLSKIPKVGDQFKGLQENLGKYSELNTRAIEIEKQRQLQSRSAFEASQAQLDKEVEMSEMRVQNAMDTGAKLEEIENNIRANVEGNAKAMTKARIQFAQDALSTTSAMLTDLQTVFQNAGKESRGLAIALKAIAIAEAGINSYLAYTKALTAYLPPFNKIVAGITLAAGLAKQAAIASTPIPSAQTGLSNYRVPETRGTRNDGAAIMAQGGETVSVTPRGEDASQTTDIRIQIEEETIFRVVQRGIRTGKINVSNRNLGAGVFV